MIRTTTGTGREVIDTGKVIVGLRAQDYRSPKAANDDEQMIQDIIRGFRPAYLPKDSKINWNDLGHRALPWVCLLCAVLLVMVL